MSSVASVTEPVPVSKEPVPKILKSGYQYRIYPVRYRYLRVKTGTEPVPYRTGTENVKSRYRIGTEKVPGSVNSVPVPGTFCSSLVKSQCERPRGLKAMGSMESDSE
ncbi:hypothetical protein Hanom_Chr01g00079681 [Helianthus anomalus]